ncbi:MAG: hypothetical protein ABI113_23900 [Mucilaginibacter sp.]
MLLPFGDRAALVAFTMMMPLMVRSMVGFFMMNNLSVYSTEAKRR